MSQFSKTLKSFVGTSNLSIQALSKNSGVDRSFIHHILTGKRIPSDRAVLENIMRALALTPSQADEIRSLYNMEKIGENLFKRNALIKELLENLVGFDTTPPHIPSYYKHDFTHYPAATMLTGTLHINTVVKAVLEEESSKSQGFVKLIIQPDYKFLNDILLTLGNSGSPLQIEHVFCLQSDLKEDSENLYNIEAFQAVLPLLLSCPHYESYVYYDNIDSKFNSTTLFPYLIITSDIVIALTADYQNAALYIDEEFYDVYSDLFNNVLRRSSALAKKIIDPMDFYMQYSVYESGASERKEGLTFTSSLFSQPRLEYFLTDDILKRYIIDFPRKDEILKLMINRNHYYDEKLRSGYECTSYFTTEGLDAFWNTGLIAEIPAQFYHPLDKEDCLILLKKLYDSILHKSYKACIINTRKLRISEKFIISAMNEVNVFLMYKHPTNGTFHLEINEPSISMSFYQFLTLLGDSDMIYTEEETKRILLQKIDEYENELCKRKREA